MQFWHDVAQSLLQILSNSAWSGISSICSLVGIPLAILLARQSKTRTFSKKNPPGIETCRETTVLLASTSLFSHYLDLIFRESRTYTT
jgi:hypothetical protein